MKLRARTPVCKPAQTSCTHARTTAHQHRLPARMPIALQASTRLCIRPQGSCKPARRSARLLTSLHACTWQMHACKYDCKPAQSYAGMQIALQASTPICKPAQTSCTHACDFAREHVTLQACTRHVQACRTACSLASHVCIDIRRTFRVKRTPTQFRCSSVVPFFLVDNLFPLELFLVPFCGTTLEQH